MSESHDPSTPSGDESLLKQWRYRIFASTWLCYAGMYFCRKPFSVVKGPMGDAYGWDAAFLGQLGAIYLLTYAIGQFLSGMAGTVFGPRRVLLMGMGGSVLANVVSGLRIQK